MYFDCGTIFQGAASELKKLFIAYIQEHQLISSSLASQDTTWEEMGNVGEVN